MSIALTPQLEAIVQQRLATGKYSSAIEVVGEALRLMEAQDQLEAAKLERLKQDVQIGLESGQSKPWNPEETKRDGRQQRLQQS